MIARKWTATEFLCFTLETGGKFISWLYFTSFSLAVVLSVLSIVFVFVDCNYFQRIVEQTPRFLESCTVIRIATTLLSVALIVVSIFACVIFKKFINGINEHDHAKMRSGVFFCGIINTIVIFVEISGMFVTFNLLDIIDIALTIVICVYFYVCLRSLYEEIQCENECKNNNIEKEADPMGTLA